MVLERLEILVGADTKGARRELEAVGRTAEKELGKAEKSSERLANKLQAFGTTGLIGSAALLGGFGLLAKASDDAEIQVSKLENSIRGSGETFTDNGKKLTDLATSIQQVTAADGDAIVGLESLLVQFGLTEDQVLTLTPLVVDLSRKMGIDLETAGRAVGRAVDGSAGALKRQGIILDENKLAADGFGTVLEGLQRQVGGFARTEGETFTGQMERLKNNLGDIGESVGAGAAGVLGSFAESGANLAASLNEVNPGILNAVGGIGATASVVGVVTSALTLGAGKALEFRNNVRDGSSALVKVGEDGERSFTKVGKAVAGIAIVGTIVGIAETVAQVSNTINDIDSRTATAFDNLRNNIDGTGIAAADAFASLVELEDQSAEFAGIWQGLGDEVSLGNINADVEEFAKTFDTVLESLGPEAAQKVIDGLREQNAALDANSEQYKVNAREIEKAQAKTNERREAVKNATIAERDQKRAVQESIDEYDRQTGTLEGVNLALKDLQKFSQAATAEFDANAAAARGFGEAIERTTVGDEQLSAALGYADTFGEALEKVGALPAELDATTIALEGVGAAGDKAGEQALSAFLSIGDRASGLLQSFIAVGDEQGARDLADRLRFQLITALREQGITDPQRIDELLGLVGLQDVQIDGAIRFANLEGELARVQTTIAIFETALRDAPPEVLLKVNDLVLEGKLDEANALLRNWVTTTSDDPATSQVGVDAILRDYPDMKSALGVAQAEADAQPINVSVKVDQRSLDNLRNRVLEGVEGTFYLETLVGQDLNNNGVVGRRRGGPVNAGDLYMVGEAGPELFRPRTSGNIVPNNQLGGTVNITQNISSPDPLLTAAEVVRRQRDAEFLAGV